MGDNDSHRRGSVLIELESWNEAITACDDKNYEECLQKFLDVPDPSAKIMFNIGNVQIVLGEHAQAIQSFTRSIEKDDHLAIALFQRGIAQYKLGSYELALNDFREAQIRLRMRNVIDYKQLGLRYKFYSCEAYYNIGLMLLKVGNVHGAKEVLEKAEIGALEKRHAHFKGALQRSEQGEVLQVFEMPKIELFRPPRSKTENMHKKDYLGKAKVVSSVQGEEDSFAGFSGPKVMEERRNSSQPNSPMLGKKSPMLGSRSPQPARRSPILTITDGLGKAMSSLKDIMVLPRSSSQSTPSPTEGVVKSAEPVGDVPIIRVSAHDNMGSPPDRPPPRPRKSPVPVDPPTKQTSSEAVEVVFHCNGSQSSKVPMGASLYKLQSLACDLFDLAPNSIDLWYLPVGEEEQEIIWSDDELRPLWETSRTSRRLELWCYSKLPAEAES